MTRPPSTTCSRSGTDSSRGGRGDVVLTAVAAAVVLILVTGVSTVFAELAERFDAGFLHIGGDEAFGAPHDVYGAYVRAAAAEGTSAVVIGGGRWSTITAWLRRLAAAPSPGSSTMNG